MKITFWSMVLCFILPLPTHACDVCGCVGSGGLSLVPHQQSSFVGLSWQSLRFSRETPASSSVDHFQLLGLQLNWKASERLQLMTVLPYRINTLHQEDQPFRAEGLGDMSLMLMYRLLPGLAPSLSPYTYTLDVGLGLKLPTGEFQDEIQLTALPTNYQLGSGSLDYLGRLRYTLAKANWNYQLDIFGRWTTVNSSGYRFGDQLSIHAFVGYWYRRVGYSVMLYTGLYTEYLSQDVQEGYYQFFTGGNGQYLSTGLESLVGENYALGVNFQPPITQNYAQGNIVAKSRFQFRLSYLF
ncbi:MAG: hypothetical protein AAF824_05260 [Bacteroidota bacterium]